MAITYENTCCNNEINRRYKLSAITKVWVWLDIKCLKNHKHSKTTSHGQYGGSQDSSFLQGNPSSNDRQLQEGTQQV